MPKLFGRHFAVWRPFAKSPQTLENALEPAVEVLSSRKAQVAPALLLATGAGVALWWWTQWAKGAAESESESFKPDPNSRTN